MSNKIQTVQRKRGRPAGRNRVPLSQEERRARNAQYERERRNEQAKAVSELADACGLDPRTSVENLLTHVCCYIQTETRRGPEESVESLRKINSDLLQKIGQAEARLAAPTPPQSPTDDEEDTCMRTRPYIYTRKVKKEIDPIESSPTSIPPIKTEVVMDYSPEQTTERKYEQVKSEVEFETMPHPHISREKAVKENDVKNSRPSKVRKLGHNTSEAVNSGSVPNTTDMTPATQTSINPSKRRRVDNESQGAGNSRSQHSTMRADGLILGLFTEEQAKYEIVQYYINLLKEEGYDPDKPLDQL